MKVTVEAAADKMNLTAIINESEQAGLTLTITAHEHDNDSHARIKSLTFGFSPDVIKEGITGNSVFSELLPANSLLTGIFVKNSTANALSISGDIVLGGSNLFADMAVNALVVGSTLPYAATWIPINHAVGSVAESFYLKSDAWNSAEIDVTFKIEII